MENLVNLLGKLKYWFLAAVGLYAMKDGKEEGDKAGVPNAVKVAYYKAKIVLQDAYDRISGSIGRTIAIAYICVMSSAALIVLGAVVGALGAETVGHGIIVIGGLVAAALAIFTWIRFAILVEVIKLASKAVGALTDKIEPISPEAAEKLVKTLATVAAWLAFISLYLSVLPIWQSLIKTGIAIIVFMFFGTVLLAGWFQSNKARITACVSAAIILVTVTLGLVFPSVEKTLLGLADRAGNAMSLWSDKNAAVDEIEMVALQKSAEADQQLLIQMYAVVQRIKERAIKNGGQFDNEQDKSAYVGLTNQIELLKSGSYWNRQAGVPQKPGLIQQVANAVTPNSSVNPAPPAEAPAASSSTAALPPPADVPRLDPPAADKPAKAHHDAKIRNELCAKYPDMCD